MVLVDIKIPPEHVQVIRSNIRPESVEKCRDVQNNHIEPISGKKLMVFPQTRFFKHRYIFLKLKTAFVRYLINMRHVLYWEVPKKIFLHFSRYKIPQVITIFIKVKKINLLLNNTLWIYRNER
jgi:hypothetical protein